MDLTLFFAHAVKLEWEAQRHYEELAVTMERLGCYEVAVFFREMAETSAKHCEQMLTRAGFDDIDELPDIVFQWPAGREPEAVDGDALDLDTAMHRSLEAERRGAAYYDGIAASATDPEVSCMAALFAAEEREHELALLRYMGEHPY